MIVEQEYRHGHDTHRTYGTQSVMQDRIHTRHYHEIGINMVGDACSDWERELNELNTDEKMACETYTQQRTYVTDHRDSEDMMACQLAEHPTTRITTQKDTFRIDEE